MQKSRNIKGHDEEDFFGQLVSKYVPYWPLFLFALLLGAAIAFFYLKYTIPLYQANASIIIKDEKKGNEDSKLTESLDLISSKKIVENEIEIIQSRKLMTSVVKKLALYAPVFEAGKIKTDPAYTTSPILVRAANPDSLEEYERIDFSFRKNSQKVILADGHAYPLNQFVKTNYGELKFVPTKYINNENNPEEKQLYFMLQRPENVAQGLVGNLIVEASGKLSSVIDLSFVDESPERAEDILNSLIATYEEFEISNKNKLARNTLSFVEDRLKVVAVDLDSIERKVQQYKSGRDAVDVSKQGQLFLQNVSENDQKLSEINMQLSVLSEVERFVADNNNKSAIVPSAFGINDPMLSQLLEKLYNAELEQEKLRKTIGENHPTMLAVKDQINKMRPNILQNIQSRKQNLQAAKQNLYATNGNYSSILQSVPQKERQLLDISREQATKSNIYAFLLQKREESELAYASADADHLVVDNAKSDFIPVAPKKGLVFFIAVAACLALCFLFVMIKESFTGKVLYRHEVESRTSIPIIGEIAYNNSKTPLIIEATKRSFVAEEFRRLRISLSFLGIDAAHRKILITSSISGEGKSFVAVNLAVSLSLTGKRVALVDLDLNNPTLSTLLKVSNDTGASEFLGGERSEEEIIHRVEAYENLFFVPPGELPKHPTELLANGRLEALIKYLDDKFDVVIIDTSPIVLVTDAYLIAAHCDATLYVVRHNYTPKMLIKRIDENNQINPIQNLGIVFNGVKIRGFFTKNYTYGYDYVYGPKKQKTSSTSMKIAQFFTFSGSM
jgi:tyrosine-protein kinase Etk/Wzc